MSSLRKLENAARRGNVQAQYQLAALLASGDTIEQDLAGALRWYEKAAKKKHPEALYNLGLMYLLGEAVEKNVQHAVDLLETAANHGSRDGQELYADILLTGRFGIRRDPRRAAYFYLRSFKEGNDRAGLSLAIAIMEKRLSTTDLSKALLQLAAELGVKEAHKLLREE